MLVRWCVFSLTDLHGQFHIAVSRIWNDGDGISVFHLYSIDSTFLDYISWVTVVLQSLHKLDDDISVIVFLSRVNVPQNAINTRACWKTQVQLKGKSVLTYLLDCLIQIRSWFFWWFLLLGNCFLYFICDCFLSTINNKTGETVKMITCPPMSIHPM